MQQIYDIDPEEFYIDRLVQNANGDYLYILKPMVKMTECFYCGSKNLIGHGFAPREVRDTTVHGHRVGLKIMAKRYKCKDCGGTPTDSCLLKTVELDAHITNRLRDYIKDKSMSKTFVEVADEIGVADTTVRRIFTDHARLLDVKRQIEAPRVLGMDENHLLGSYRAIFTDIEGRKLLDMLDNRFEENVIKWIETLPGKENIEVVTCDMYKGYKGAAQKCLPSAAIVIDKFHVVKMANDALETIRKSLRSELGKDDNRALRKSRWLLLSNSEELDFDDQKLLSILLDKYPQFETPHKLKEDFRDIYQSKDRKSAESAFAEWSSKVNEYGRKEFKGIVRTVNRWKDEVFSYFDHKYTNAFTESINNIINRVDADGRGYSFEVLRLKCLFGTQLPKSELYNFRDFDDLI